jgi:lipoic acid synthetase
VSDDLGIVTIDPAPPRRLPRWLKRNVPLGTANHFTARLLGELNPQTVCDHARCPNRMECYAQKTATFMILGDTCTRPCGFCSVNKGKTQPPAQDEPDRLAEACRRLELSHVVLTSVTRDDLPDGGAEHFYRCVTEIRRATGATLEVLTPDFAGSAEAVDRVLAARPEVFNHNTETVPRLYAAVRGRKSEYRWTLGLLAHVKVQSPGILT